MTNTKMTKKALFLSCMSMLLCVTMLVGTTFAWFTDTATTGVNTIVAGNLDIKLSYMNAADSEYTEVSAQTTDLFVNADDSAILWEPGATAVCYFKLENVGSLALQYKMKVAYKDTVTYGDVKLSNALKSAIVELGEGEKLDRDDVATALADVNAVNALGFQDAEGIKMESGATRYFAIVITMPTEIGNDYNIPTGEPSLQIQLGIELVATQITAESDSFDDQYDKDATFTVASSGSLLDAIKGANDGDTIVLAQDIVLNEQVQIPENKDVTIDLAGNKLSLGGVDDNGDVADGITVGNGATLNLVNTGAEKTTIEYLGDSTNYDAIYVSKGGELNIGGNVELVVSPKANSAIHATDGAVVNIGEGTNIIVDGDTEDQFAAIYIDGATVNMTGGTITLNMDLSNYSGWINDAVGVMLLGSGGTFNMTGGTITVESKGAMAQAVQISTYNGAGDSLIYIDGGTFNINETGNGTSYAFAIFDPSEGTVVVNDATFNGAYTAAVSTYYDGTPNITITGGTYAFDPTAYAPGCEVTKNADGTYTVKQLFAVNGDTITVNSPDVLSEAIAYAKTSTEAVTINLPAGEMELPTDLSQNWGSYQISFIGAVNADGTPATTMNVPNTTGNYTVWSVSGTIENIVFADETNAEIIWITDGNGTRKDVTFNNCVFDGATLRFNAAATFTSCIFDGNDAAWSGLQYCYPQGNVVIDGCTFSGYRFTNLQVTEGDSPDQQDVTITVKNCTIGALVDGWNESYSNEGVTLWTNNNIVLENNTIDCDVYTPGVATVTKTNNETSAGGEVSYKSW